MTITANLPNEVDRRKAQVEYLAQKVAARLYQRFMRANPTKEFLTLATPILSQAILEGRRDLTDESKKVIDRMAADIARLHAMNDRQAKIILRHGVRRGEVEQPGSEGGPA